MKIAIRKRRDKNGQVCVRVVCDIKSNKKRNELNWIELKIGNGIGIGMKCTGDWVNRCHHHVDWSIETSVGSAAAAAAAVIAACQINLLLKWHR